MFSRNLLAAHFPALDWVAGATGYFAAVTNTLPCAVAVDKEWQVAAYLAPAESAGKKFYRYGVCRLVQYPDYQRHLARVVEQPWPGQEGWHKECALHVSFVNQTSVQLHLVLDGDAVFASEAQTRGADLYTPVDCAGLSLAQARKAAFTHAVHREIDARVRQVTSNSPFVWPPTTGHRIDADQWRARWYVLYQVGESSFRDGDTIELRLDVWEKNGSGLSVLQAIEAEPVLLSSKLLKWRCDGKPTPITAVAKHVWADQYLSLDNVRAHVLISA